MPNNHIADDDVSMIILRGQMKREGHHLISCELGLEIARSVLEYYYGPDRYRLNMPLSITDQDDNWVVTGAAPHATLESFHEAPETTGRYEIHIDKYNARITKLVFT